MINKLTQRHSYDNIENSFKYMIECPTCGTVLNFGKDDVYKSEDELCIHHEYINCPQCNEKIQLIDNDYFGIMKLINKDALVAELKERIRNYWSDTENAMGIYPYALEEVVKYVDTLEVKEVDLYNNGWIDCGKQMPKETKQTSDTLQGHHEWTESDLVLVWDSHYGAGIDSTRNGKWRSEQKGGYTGQICHDIIAWRPIPNFSEELLLKARLR